MTCDTATNLVSDYDKAMKICRGEMDTVETHSQLREPCLTKSPGEEPYRDEYIFTK